MSTSLAWDERYRGGGFQFGEAPNDHLRAQSWRLRPGMAALCLGDGEGRNGVFLAQQGLAVTTLDARVADAAAWDYPQAHFDVIAWIYLHLPPADRHAAALGCLRALKPGGILILECFSPAQEGRRSGGPKLPELLWSRHIAEQEFRSLDTLELTEGAVRLDEGPRHQGLAEVVRGVWRR